MSKCRSCGNEYIGNQCNPCRNKRQRLYRINNIEKTRAQAKVNQKKYREKNKEKISIYLKEYINKNKEKLIKYKAEWSKNNPAKIKARRNNRRARIKNVGGVISANLYDKLVILQKNKCACCKIDLAKTKVHMDHIFPIALGGKNEDSNIQLLCQSCNCQKHAKHPIEFMQSKGYLL